MASQLDASQLDRVGSFLIELAQAMNGGNVELSTASGLPIQVEIDGIVAGRLCFEHTPMSDREDETETTISCQLEVGNYE